MIQGVSFIVLVSVSRGAPEDADFLHDKLYTRDSSQCFSEATRTFYIFISFNIAAQV
jgi:hypothetical protein